MASDFDAAAWAASKKSPTAPAAFDAAAWAKSKKSTTDFAGSDEDFLTAVAERDALRNTPAGFGTETPALQQTSDEAVPKAVRAQASFKGTQTGVYNYLRHQYGADNVEPVLSKRPNITTPDGQHVPDQNWQPQIENFLIRLAPEGKSEDGKKTPAKVVLFDPKGLDFGDITDLAATTVETLPSVIGAAAGGAAGTVVGGPGVGTTAGGIAGSAAGALAGNAARQYIGAQLPGAENMSVADRAKSAGGAVAAGVLGEAAGPVARFVGRAIKAPAKAAFNTAGRVADKMLGETVSQVGGNVTGKEAALASMPLFKETGVEPTLAQLTGGEGALNAESALFQNNASAGVVASKEGKQAVQIGDYINKVLDRSLGPDASRLTSSEAVHNVANAVVGSQKKIRSVANEAFGKAMDAADAATGGQPIFSMTELSKEMQAIVKDHSRTVVSSTGQAVPMRTSSDAAVADQIGAMATKLGDNPKAGAISINNLLKDYGKKAKTGEGLLMDVPRGEQKVIAARLKDALDRDLDAAAAAGVGGDAAGIIRNARTDYKAQMGLADKQKSDLVDDLLKRVDKGGADTVPDMILNKSLGGDRVAGMMTIMDRADPIAAKQFKDSVMQRIMERAQAQRGNLVAAGAEIDPGQFAAIDKRFGPQIKALYAGDPEGYAAYRKGVDVMRKITDHRSVNRGAQTYAAFSAGTSVGESAASAIAAPRTALIGWLKNRNAAQTARLVTDPRRIDVMLGLERAVRGNGQRAIDAVSHGIAQLTALDDRDKALFSGAPSEDATAAPAQQQTQQPVASDDGYRKWLKTTGVREDPTYDTRGAFEAGLKPDKNGHLEDTYKLPTHPTFSDESKYSGRDGKSGGTWTQVGMPSDERWAFKASPWNLQNMSKEQLMDYFDRVEPGNTIRFPDGSHYVGGSRKSKQSQPVANSQRERTPEIQ